MRAILNLLADQISLRPATVTDGARKPKKAGVRERLQEAHQQGRLSFLKNYGVETPGQALLKYVLSQSAVSTIIVATGKSSVLQKMWQPLTAILYRSGLAGGWRNLYAKNIRPREIPLRYLFIVSIVFAGAGLESAIIRW